jgi:hypothetical protein
LLSAFLRRWSKRSSLKKVTTLKSMSLTLDSLALRGSLGVMSY